MTGMTKGERSELLSLIKKRERVMKTQVAQRSAELLAGFEEQISTIYNFDDSEVWSKAHKIAMDAVAESNKAIAEECKKLGIPEEFSPCLSAGWIGRYSTASSERRNELRKVAKAQIDVAEKAAKTQVERLSLNAQTELVVHGLNSDAAKLFLEQMPSMEVLMPEIDAIQLQKLDKAEIRKLLK